MIYLISEDTLKKESLINDNVESCYIMPSIKIAQEIGLQTIIGSKLYKKILSKVENNTIDGNYKELLDNYICNYLIFKTMAEIQIPLFAKFRNSGMVQNTNENLTNISLNEVNSIVNYYQYKADFYGNRLSDFLKNNKSDFPEFNQCEKNGINSEKISFSCNINI